MDYEKRKNNNNKKNNHGLCFYSVQHVFWHPDACTREKQYTTAERGDYLPYMILKVKAETGTESRLSAVIQSLGPNSGRFVMRISAGHRGLVSLDFIIISGMERLPRRTVWIPVCLSILKFRLCQDVVIRCVSPLPGCQLFLQNFSSPFSNTSFLLLPFPRKI